jgi:hypothetical protein
MRSRYQRSRKDRQEEITNMSIVKQRRAKAVPADLKTHLTNVKAEIAASEIEIENALARLAKRGYTVK